MKTSNEIGKIIKSLRGDESLRDFAKKCDLSHTTIDNLEKGIDFRTGKPTQVKLATLQKISLACGVPESIFYANNDIDTYNNLFQIKKKKIPFLGDIACGQPIWANEDRESYVMVGTDIQADFCLRCKGDSMIGARILDGDIVFIKQMNMVNDGEIAAVIIEDEATLKRITYIREKNLLILKAENPKYQDLVYIGEELDHIHILGKAIAFQSDVK